MTDSGFETSPHRYERASAGDPVDAHIGQLCADLLASLPYIVVAHIGGSSTPGTDERRSRSVHRWRPRPASGSMLLCVVKVCFGWHDWSFSGLDGFALTGLLGCGQDREGPLG